MPIRAYLTESGTFDLIDMQCMSIALEDVCKALKLSAHAVDAKQIIAERIIELARKGVCDPHKLCGRVLQEAGADEGT